VHPRAEQEVDFLSIFLLGGKVWRVGVVNLAVLACVLRRTTKKIKKRSSTFWRKSAPRRENHGYSYVVHAGTHMVLVTPYPILASDLGLNILCQSWRRFYTVDHTACTLHCKSYIPAHEKLSKLAKRPNKHASIQWRRHAIVINYIYRDIQGDKITHIRVSNAHALVLHFLYKPTSPSIRAHFWHD